MPGEGLGWSGVPKIPLVDVQAQYAPLTEELRNRFEGVLESAQFIRGPNVKAFEEEMKAAGVTARVITYPQAKHAFTNPDAGKAGMDALAYDADADARSWAEAAKFFRETFGT